MEKELTDLRAQVRDISDLAREYRAQVQLLSSELSDFRRREPLVQLLWHEIVQVKCALEAAVAAGFSYDAGEPSSRFVDVTELRGIAEVNGLDVTRMLDGPPHTHIATRTHSRGHSHVKDEGGAANAMLDEFQPVYVPQINTDTPALAPAPAPALPTPLASPPLPPDAPPTPHAPDAPPAPSLSPAAPPLAPPPGMSSSPALILPTKSLVQPPRKMKAVHWQRLIIGEGGKREGRPTLWSEVEEVGMTETVGDWDDLVQRFSDLRASVKGGGPGKGAGGEGGGRRGRR